MITDNSAIFYNSTICSHSAVIAGQESAVYGYYSREYVEYDTGRGVIDGYKPVFNCSAEIAKTISRKTAVTVSGVVQSFTVAHIKIVDETEAQLILVEA